MRTRYIFAATVALLGLGWLAGCGLEGEVRDALQAEGLTEIELAPGDERGEFTFTGARPGEECSGTYTIRKRGITTSTSSTMLCQPPAGPVTEALPDGVDPEVESHARYCDAGDMGQCNDLGFDFDHGRGVAEDEARALELYELACNGGDGMGCSNAGILFNNPDGAAFDRAKALARFEDGCRLDNGKACFNGALNIIKHTENPDFTRARELASKGCDLGSVDACNSYGVLLVNGQGGPADRAGALAMFEKACDAGEPVACDNVAKLGKR